MTRKKFDSVVKKAVYHGNEYRKQIDILEQWCLEKYNCNWSDLDCDDIIDALEFGEGILSPMTFEEFKQSIESRI